MGDKNRKEEDIEKSLNALWVGLGKLCVMWFVLMPIQICWNAFVITKIWQWFIVDYFYLPQITIPLAVGFGMLMLLFSRNALLIKEEFEVERGWKIFHSFAEPAMLLLIGWITTWFV